jgi:hypothetical protein
LALTAPESLDELAKVKGIGRETAERFGEAFLEAVRHWRKQRDTLTGKD